MCPFGQTLTDDVPFRVGIDGCDLFELKPQLTVIVVSVAKKHSP